MKLCSPIFENRWFICTSYTELRSIVRNVLPILDGSKDQSFRNLDIFLPERLRFGQKEVDLFFREIALHQTPENTLVFLVKIDRVIRPVVLERIYCLYEFSYFAL